MKMPYITFAKPTDENSEKEKKLREAEEDTTRIIHRLTTLDTYHFGTTDKEKAQARDSQQVVSRHAKIRGKIDDHEIPVLHVGQLWLWVIDEGKL
jgi:translation initiation factor IF-3